MTKLIVSIIAFNKLDLTKKCVESALAALSTYKDSWMLLLHDNASTDGVGQFFDGIRTSKNKAIHYPTNTGFQIPTEAAFAAAKAADADYLVVLNNDAVAPLNFLDLLQAEMERHPAAAIVGCRDGCCTVTPDLHGYHGHTLEYIELSCAMIAVKKVAKHFDRLFAPWLSFAYGEDLLLSLKMQKQGYTIHRAPFAIEHQRGATSVTVPGIREIQAANHAAIKEHWAHWIKHRTFSHRIVVRRWHSIGDVLLATPVIRRLYEENPLCEIVVETNFPALFAGNPCVAHAATSVGRQPTDLVIDLDMSSENSPMRHFVTSYARTAGVDDPPHKTEFYAHLGQSPVLQDYRWAAIHTHTTWPGKNWSVEKFAVVVEYLRSLGFRVVEVGATNDYPAVAGIDLDLRGKTSLAQLGAALKQCELFVGVDSFPMHLAGAVGTPVVGIFGITESRFILSGSGPQIGVDADQMMFPRAGERHRIAGVTFIAEYGECINSIGPERVIAAVNELTPTVREVYERTKISK